MSTSTISRASARQGLLLVLLAGMLWGTSGVTIKTIYGLAETTPISVAALRLAMGAPALLAVSWRVAGRRSPSISRFDLLLLPLVGLLMGVYQLCYFLAIPRVGVAVATLVCICTGPVLVALISTVLLRERLSRTVMGALACALLGTVLLVGGGTRELGLRTEVVEGVALSLAGALGYALLLLASRRLGGRYHPLQSTAVAITVGALLLLTVSSATTGLVMSYPPVGWTLLVYLGLVPTALAYGIFFHGMRYATPAVASIGTLAEPLTASVLAMLIFGERLGTKGLVGAALLIGAMVFLYRNSSSAEG